ncbi:MAG: pyridoxal-dependent decarboxylase [Candidatus Poseidoniia archaeon]|nr:pyridoxal-dependent decarboxylase [Candidatus Poseidoniia archaeon]
MNKEEEILLKDVHAKILSYLDNPQIKPIETVENIRNNLNITLGSSSDFDHIRTSVDKYLQYSTKTSSSNFFNQLYGGFSITGHIGEMLSSITNNSMYTYEMSPVSTLMEIELVKKMSSLVGYENGGGIFVPGGSNGNLLAMLAARQKKAPETIKKGLFQTAELTVFVSKDSHYSMVKSAIQLGIGMDNVIKVDTDNEGKMLVSDLERLIKESIGKNQKPFFVGATSGSTVRGSFDSLNDINNICKKYNLWLHVDGSWGGSALLSKEHRNLLKGAEKSDSFSWCAHKAMSQPLICTVALFKTPSILRELNSIEGTNYLFHDETDEINIGEYSLQCGRRVDSLKLWLTWKYLGDNGFEKHINHLFDMAKYAEEKINSSEKLVLISPVNYLNLCFQIKPKGLNVKQINDFTIAIRHKLLEKGKAMVNYAKIDDNDCIRLVTVNPDLTTEHLDTFFRNIEEVSGLLLKEY